MCGFSALIKSPKKKYEFPAEHNGHVSKMLDLMHHRGPDNRSIFSDDNVVLGHVRLSIIDSSDEANQPMKDRSGRFILVYNGEVYNYLELKVELQGLGYKFKTKSDSEVMLYALIHWGKDALQKLNGMFAGCLYDKSLKTSILFRDRFGQKPLYYCHLEKGLIAFASEIKPIIFMLKEVTPNENSWARYLTEASYDDNIETMFNGVEQLSPGELLSINENLEYSRCRWYKLEDSISTNSMSFETASNALAVLLDDATNIHMRSDVDIGICLSGGLDSSLLASCVNRSRLSQRDLQCLSVEFDNELSEKKWINSVAEQFNFQSEILNFSVEEFFKSIKPMMWHLEGPIGGLMNCAMTKVFQRSKELGIRVMQDGTGLDEAFGGYRYHHNLYLKSLLDKDDKFFQKSLNEYTRSWGVDFEKALEDIKTSGQNLRASIDGTLPYRLDLLNPEYVQNFQPQLIDQTVSKDLFSSSLISYITREKIPRNTRMKDRLSMAHSVELRLPFLDHRVIEFGLSLNSKFLFKDGLSKSILRHCSKDRLSSDVRLAQKRSIQAPQGRWLAKPIFREYVNDILDSQLFRNLNIFDLNLCKMAYKDHIESNAANSFFIWQWINVYEWYHTFKYNDPTENKYSFMSL